MRIHRGPLAILQELQGAAVRHTCEHCVLWAPVWAKGAGPPSPLLMASSGRLPWTDPVLGEGSVSPHGTLRDGLSSLSVSQTRRPSLRGVKSVLITQLGLGHRLRD